MTVQNRIPVVHLYGLPVSRLGMRETLQYLERALLSGQSLHVVTINPIMIMDALRSPEKMLHLRAADLIVPDGAGVVWAARYAGFPVKERVPGIELMQGMIGLAERNGWGVYLLGASAETVELAAQRLREWHPGLNIVGYRDGFFGEDEDGQVIESIRAARPHLLFVARDAKRQEPWIAKHRKELGVPFVMGVGGSLDVISGRLKRAPKTWQNLRLEWLYRLLQEPRRFRRMLVLPQFVFKVLKDGAKAAKIGE